MFRVRRRQRPRHGQARDVGAEGWKQDPHPKGGPEQVLWQDLQEAMTRRAQAPWCERTEPVPDRAHIF